MYSTLCKDGHPDFNKKVQQLLHEYSTGFSNQLVKNFLNQSSYYDIFFNAVCMPSEVNVRRLNQAFQSYYMEIRFTYYMSQVIWRYAKDFKAKKKTHQDHYVLILDQPLQEQGSSTLQTLRDQLSAEYNNEDMIIENNGHLLERIGNPNLYKGLKKLTKKQVRVLELYFVYQLTHAEIAFSLGVSQQAVTKSIGQSLLKLKKRLKSE